MCHAKWLFWQVVETSSESAHRTRSNRPTIQTRLYKFFLKEISTGRCFVTRVCGFAGYALGRAPGAQGENQ